MNNYYQNSYRKQESEMTNLFTPDEAIQYGTVFKALALPYKNIKRTNVKVNQNEKDKLMYDIQKYDLSCHDLSLYLDVFPNDKNALEMRMLFENKLNEAKKRYEDKYPPFCKSSEKLDDVPYSWSTTPFPWDGK